MPTDEGKAFAAYSQLLNQLRQRVGPRTGICDNQQITPDEIAGAIDIDRLLNQVNEALGQCDAERVQWERKSVEFQNQCEKLSAEVAELRQVEERLRESEERYQLAMRGANDGLWDWDLQTGRICFSARWKSMIGYEEGEIGTGPGEWFDRIHPEDLAAVEAAIWSHLQGTSPHFEIEYRLRHRDGQYRWMLTRGLALRQAPNPANAAAAQSHKPGRPYRIAGSQTDTTARKLSEQQLLRDAFHDVLTGLPNRALLIDRLQRSIARVKRSADYHFAVLFLDMDRFKVVNDSLGHIVGDRLLIDFSRRLASCLRAGDTVARLGGDEYAILLEDIDDETAALRVAERVHDSLRRPFVLDFDSAAAQAGELSGEQCTDDPRQIQHGSAGSLSGTHSHEVFTTASIGIAYSGGGYDHAQDVLRDADTAMYRAKASGKSGHQLFDSAMHARAVRLLQIETDLRRAIELSQFEVHYQPIVALGTGRIHSLEALVRWRHPEKGMIPPGEFIPVAEEAGLIGQIGAFVLREACRQMAAWHGQLQSQTIAQSGGNGSDPPRHERLMIAVNLSARQLAQHDLVERVGAILSECGLPGGCLVLEITESTVMESAESAVDMLRRLRAMDVRINLDDFGTGYSSLAYLHRIPADTMKIDRSFVSRMSSDRENAEIVRTIVSLAHGLKMQVTAEGIETAEQLSQVQQLGCEYAQGYFFSKPLDSAAMTQLLAGNIAWPNVAAPPSEIVSAAA